MIEEPTTFGAPQDVVHMELLSWRTFEEGRTYECRALVCPEDDGGYSAFALRLPGVVSQGESVKEALENLSEAFRGAILAYGEYGDQIPWEHYEIDRPKGSMERWILVNV